MNLKKQRRPGRQLPRGSLIVKYILVLLIAVVLPFAGVLFAVSAKATWSAAGHWKTSTNP